jgi:hypothetical protein
MSEDTGRGPAPADPARQRRWTALGVGGLGALVLTIGLLGFTGVIAPEPTVAAPHDMRGNAVTLDPDATPDPRASATPDGSGRFIAASVGLDVPLGSLFAVDGEVTPPGFTSAYLVRNEGVPPARSAHGTVFVVMHSLRDGAVGPGNHLIDVDAARARIAVGATITVDDVAYRVTGSAEVRKDELSRQSALWRDDPGRLVVITCLQRPQGGPSVDNVVILAQRSG